MFSSSFSDLVALSILFDLIPMGKNLLHYLAQPYSGIEGLAEKALIKLKDRAVYDNLGGAPLDTAVYKSRFNLMHENNRAYYLACLDNPSVSNLIEFSSIRATWAILKSVKDYLHHYPSLAKRYTGLVPLGKNVVVFFNKFYKTDIPHSSPNYAHHVEIQKQTNILAKKFNVSSMVVNDLMYIEGGKILQNTNK